VIPIERYIAFVRFGMCASPLYECERKEVSATSKELKRRTKRENRMSRKCPITTYLRAFTRIGQRAANRSETSSTREAAFVASEYSSSDPIDNLLKSDFSQSKEKSLKYKPSYGIAELSKKAATHGCAWTEATGRREGE